jgi:16S rRNA (guanine527-N7)-methyltransferase
MKGRQGDEELAQAQGAYSKLGAAISPTDVHRFEIYGDARMILAVRKTKATPASYPRAYAQIKKKPLS